MSHLGTTRNQAGAAAAHAGAFKVRKYSSLVTSHTFVALAVETFGPYNREGLEFVTELGRRITQATGDPRETSFLFQQISAAVQQGNAAAFKGTFPQGEDDEDGVDCV